MQYTTLMSQSFRSIIKREMKRQDLSGYALAKQVDGRIPARTVYAYLAGTDLRGETVAVLADALGLELQPKRRQRKAGS
jgi:hypothetical protein